MKKSLIILVAVIAVACSGRNVDDLKLNVDKPTDVENKLGKPDSIARESFFGVTGEFWSYKHDSVCLLFRNDILIKIEKHCVSGFGVSESEKEAIKINAEHRADSIAAALDVAIQKAMDVK